VKSLTRIPDILVVMQYFWWQPCRSQKDHLSLLPFLGLTGCIGFIWTYWDWECT